MNPVRAILEEQGCIPLPDLLQRVSLDRTKVLQVIQEHESIDLKVRVDEDRNIAYHEVMG